MSTCPPPAGIDLASETPIPFLEARDHIPGRPHASTLHRWRMSGKLTTFKVGGRLFTTIEETERFLHRCNAGLDRPAVTTATRRRQIAQAERTLRRAGIV